MTQWFVDELCVSLIFVVCATVSKLEKMHMDTCKPYRICSSFFPLSDNIVKQVSFFPSGKKKVVEVHEKASVHFYIFRACRVFLNDFCFILVTPLDVIKTRLQAQSNPFSKGK